MEGNKVVGATRRELLAKIPAVIEGIRACNDEWELGINMNASFGLLQSLGAGATMDKICEGVLAPVVRGFESDFEAETEPLVSHLNERLGLLTRVETLSREGLALALRRKTGTLFPLIELVMQIVALPEPFVKETQLFVGNVIDEPTVKSLGSRVGEVVMPTEFWLATTSEDRAITAARERRGVACVYKIRSLKGRRVYSINGDGSGAVVLFPPGSLFVVERVVTLPSGVVIIRLVDLALHPVPSWTATECNVAREAWWKGSLAAGQATIARAKALCGLEKVAPPPSVTADKPLTKRDYAEDLEKWERRCMQVLKEDRAIAKRMKERLRGPAGPSAASVGGGVTSSAKVPTAPAKPVEVPAVTIQAGTLLAANRECVKSIKLELKAAELLLMKGGGPWDIGEFVTKVVGISPVLVVVEWPGGVCGGLAAVPFQHKPGEFTGDPTGASFVFSLRPTVARYPLHEKASALLLGPFGFMFGLGCLAIAGTGEMHRREAVYAVPSCWAIGSVTPFKRFEVWRVAL
jgi:hypothetical protein